MNMHMLHRLLVVSVLAILAVGIVCAAWPGAALAVEPDEILADAALEARARKLSHDLRCLVCQNQSIDDSNASLARDLRVLVRQRLQQGDSDAKVRAFVVERYGEFVLLRPPLSLNTLLLWATPLLLLALIGFVVVRNIRMAARPESQSSAALNADERSRLEDILKREL